MAASKHVKVYVSELNHQTIRALCGQSSESEFINRLIEQEASRQGLPYKRLKHRGKNGLGRRKKQSVQ